MNKETYLKDIYSIVDAKDGAALAAKITDDGIFRFANMPPVKGRKEITAFLDQFFQSIKGIGHDQIEEWYVNDTRFAIGSVSYTRHDNTVLTVPFSTVLRMQGNMIAEYLVFVDASELYK